ncbi:ABC transporter substrate-binding protein [Diaphorobacter nitroreducens]|uniref:ABC transporter substrate-binding protein n=1 Tax=Diaphorobacter nitroreducens TaxID=164759 RepID=UPI00289DC0A8|nr:ABC transporter substrate-binding protein [Diaphorobacter nitroreducens]
MKNYRAFVLALSLLAAPLVHATQVVVGQVGPMSGLDANQGRAYAAGMQLLFNSVNKSGGVNGHTFTLVRKDDGGRPEDTIAATREMLAEDKPLVLAGYFGSRSINELVKSGLLEKDRIALVGYRTSEIRAETPLVYNVRASLRDEINKLTEHLATIGITRLGLFYEEGPGAPAVVTAAEEAAKKARGSIVTKAAYPAGTSSVANAVEVFLKTPPQAILMVSSGAAAAGFIEQYRSGGGAAQLFAHSGADIEQLSKRLSEEQMQGVAIAQVTPSPYKISGRLGKEFGDLVAKNPPEVPVSYAMMEGFIAAKVIAEAVRRQGARPTREGVAAALDSMDNVDLGGYVVGFKPGARNGSKFVELSIISGAGRIRQ